MNRVADNGDSGDRSPGRPWTGWICLALAGAGLVGFRLHAFALPLEADECNYAYIGARLLAGDRLYIDVWDHQPFGVFVLFAGVTALFGDAPEVFRCLAIAFSLASLVVVFAILRRISGRPAAIAGAFLFAIVSSDPGTAGEGCNREVFMATLILAGWYLALKGDGRPGWPIALSGCAFALASAIKTIVAVHWLFLAVWIGIAAWQRASAERRVRLVTVSIATFAAGPLALWLVTFAYFGATGRLGEFIDAVFLFNLSYSGGGESFLMRFVRFFAPQRHPFIFDSALPLWIGGIAATVWLLIEGALRRNRGALAIVMLVLGSYVAVCLPARFWPHYYYLLIPVLVIAVSMAVGRLVNWIRDTIPARLAGARDVSLALFAVLPIAVLATEYRDFLRYRDYFKRPLLGVSVEPPFGITVKRYNSRDFWGRAHGENIRRVTDPDDEIFVFGNDPEIYYYAQRRCASRYTMITGLQSVHAGADERRRILMDELEERLPRLIVVLFDEEPFDKWRSFLQRRYGEPVGWDFHDGHRKPIMFVLARKDQPIAPIDWDWDRSEVGGWMLGEDP